MANPFYNPGSLYGGPYDFYDTPIVRDYLSPSAFAGEFERLLSQQGLGALDRKSSWARGLMPRAQQGYEAALLTNPGLSNRDYLTQTFGPGFFDNAWNALTPTQRGEEQGRFGGRARWVPWS